MILFIGLCSMIIHGNGHPSILLGDSDENEVPSYDFPFVPRSQWHARTPNETTNLSTPVPYVVIHHSHSPAACYNREDCSRAMRSMQNFHMDDKGWCDIGYSFGVGSDGVVYEGRGWSKVGAHAVHFNPLSIGICLIGDWQGALPPAEQIKAAKSLIAAGVELGFLRADYKLVGHRQVRATECPGEALFEDIKTWSHYSPFPSCVDDLLYVPELPEKTRAILMNATKVN